MSIGFTANATVGSLNSQLGVAAVAMRNAAQMALQLAALTTAETATGLEAIGFTSGDAANFITSADYLQTLAQVYYGTATQSTDFNFDTALAAVRAGQ